MLRLISLVVFVVSCASATWAIDTDGSDGDSVAAREFSFYYSTTIFPEDVRVDSGGAEERANTVIDIYLPLAVNNAQQQVLSETLNSPVEGVFETEDVYGNRYWHGRISEPLKEPLTIELTTTVRRTASTINDPKSSPALSSSEQQELQRFLKENNRVLVSHPVLKPILTEIRQAAASEDPAVISRAIYDWVIENVEYKKIGNGWGNGDTFWACNERYGNCTDFHSLFISLARSENIPARFEMGFPVPTDRDSGTIGGHHCWVEFYLPSVGWFPIDASEAFKHPEKKEMLYGSHNEDRIHFSTGRDLVLGDSHSGKPLNYFIYPYIEGVLPPNNVSRFVYTRLMV